MMKTLATIKIERRKFHWITWMLLLFVAVTLPLVEAETDNQSVLSPPAATQLESGDLIWPKKPEAVVPFNSQPGEAGKEVETRWQREKEAYLGKLRRKPDPTQEEKERYSVLQPMTYKEFAALYLDDRVPGEPVPFGVGAFYVGHVGIVEVENGSPTIIEAVMGKGVRRVSYDEWLRERKGELVWLARLKDVSPEKRAAVAKAASEHIGKPYDFWDFNLMNIDGFYCSKLAWYSILTGAGFSPDDNPSPSRVFWYSPKRLMRSRHIELIANPGSYSSRN